MNGEVERIAALVERAIPLIGQVSPHIEIRGEAAERDPIGREALEVLMTNAPAITEFLLREVKASVPAPEDVAVEARRAEAGDGR